MAVALAEQLGVTVCGYVRAEGFNLYAGDAITMDAEVTRSGNP
jgi:formate dehydrogenase assembly factor FdhD